MGSGAGCLGRKPGSICHLVLFLGQTFHLFVPQLVQLEVGDNNVTQLGRGSGRKTREDPTVGTGRSASSAGSWETRQSVVTGLVQSHKAGQTPDAC